MNGLKYFMIFLMIGFCFLNKQAISQEILFTKGPGSYRILGENVDTIKIPFTMLKGKPVMQVEINGEKGKLMIDNGVLWDQVWLFGSPLVTKLNLKPIDEGSIEGSDEGEPTSFYTARNITLKFDDIIFYDQPVLVSPPAAGFAKLFPGTDGQLCNTFFKHFIVELNFIAKQIVLYKPEQFHYTGNGSVLDMELNKSGTHSIPFKLEMSDGKIYDDRVDIDFGGIYPLKIALNNRHNIQLPVDVKRIHSTGAQGKNTEYSGKIKSLTFGKYTFNNPDVVFGDAKTSRIFPDNLGVIGLPLFMKFNIIFDYISNKIYIDPNENFDKPF